MTDKVAVVVGGTSGIGLATARRLADHGATVHVTGRSRERLEAAAKTDGRLHTHQCDGTSAEDVERFLASVGRVDWLVLALSGGAGAGAFRSLDLGVLREAFEAKFWGHVTTTQRALAHLADDGSITFISAGSARSAITMTAGLAAVNGALEAMVKPLAVELAPIRVNAVSPGVVDTPWWSGMPDEARAAYFAQAEQALPIGRIATAEDVAEAVVLAAVNPNLTGTVIESDGGARLVSLG
jgi:NAD(P)-dependent dehydrogenase (short-subunit alcohol dehydrogenase family)